MTELVEYRVEIMHRVTKFVETQVRVLTKFAAFVERIFFKETTNLVATRQKVII